jgi:hypothetical protein
MGSFASRIKQLSLVLHCIADWFFIVAGLVLIIWALVSVDVTFARYLLIIIGVLLAGSGCWFRYLSARGKGVKKKG